MGRSREGSNRRAVGARRNQLRRVTGPPLVTASSLVRSVHGCRGAGLLLPPSRARTRPLLEAFYAPRRCCLRRGHSSGSRTRCSLSSTFEPQGTRRLPAELLEAPSRVAGRIGDEASRSAAAFRCALALSLGSGPSGRKPVGVQVPPWSLLVSLSVQRRSNRQKAGSRRSRSKLNVQRSNIHLTFRRWSGVNRAEPGAILRGNPLPSTVPAFFLAGVLPGFRSRTRSFARSPTSPWSGPTCWPPADLRPSASRCTPGGRPW